MNRYFCLIALLIAVLTLWAAAPYAAKIGQRQYSEKELKDGFKAYLEFKNPGHPLDAADSLSYFEQYFDELIAMNIYNGEIQRRGLGLSDNELEERIKTQPPQGIKQIADFQEAGEFSLNKYQKALQEEPDFKREVMQVSRDMYSYHALLQAVRAEAVVDEKALKQKWQSTAKEADAEIIYFDYTQYKDIEATSLEARAYYESVKESEYKKYSGRSLYYVHFPGTSSRATSSPEALQKSAADSRALFNLAAEIGLPAAAKGLKYELKESPLFSRYDPFIRGVGREPGLIAMAFAYPLGWVFEPYKNSMGDTFIIAVANEQEVYYEDFEPLAQIMQMRANSLKRAEKNREIAHAFIQRYSPQDYLSAAQKDKLRIVEQNGIQLNSSFPPIGGVEVLNSAILSTAVGEFTPLIEHSGMYYLARVKARTLPEPEDWEKAKEMVLPPALAAAQDAHLDAWFLAKKAALSLKYPAELSAKNP